MDKSLSNGNMENFEEEIDLKEILFKYLRYWPLLLGFMFFGIIVAFLVNKLSTPIYQVNASVLIKDEPAMALGADIFENVGMPMPKANVENEMGILNSFSLALETINQLKFNTFFYKEELFGKSEFYGNFPYFVEIDWNHAQITEGLLSIEKLDQNRFNLKIEKDDFYLFTPLDPYFKTEIEYVELKENEYRFGEWIEGESFKFRVFDISGSLDEVTYIKFRDSPSLANYFREFLVIQPQNKMSNVLVLKLETNIRKKGEDYLNKLMEVYLNRELKEKNQIAFNTVNFIDQQLSGIVDSLSFIEDRLEKYRSANNVFNLTQEGNVIFTRLNELEQQKAQIDLSLSYYRTIQNYLLQDQLNDLAAPSFIGIQDPLLNALVMNLGELQSERVRLSATFSEATPAVKEVVNRIQNTKNTLLENIKSGISNAEVSLNEVSRRLQTTEREISKLPSTERNLLSIRRQFTINENIYIYLLEKRAEAEITKASNAPTNAILDFGRAEPKPVSPRKLINLLIGTVLGLFFPLAYITLKNLFNVRVQEPQEVEKALRIPLIGLVSQSPYKSNLVIASNPKSNITETFRNLRANMGYLAPRQNKLVFAISSTISGEGKTFCSINLASIYAISDKKCILVGLDLRKPRIADDFGFVNDVGVSTYLSTDKDWRGMVKKTKIKNLEVLLSGPIPPNPAELLLQNNFHTLIEQLKEKYDIVILDCPPVGLVSETYEIFKFSDLNLMIIRQNYSEKESLEFINSLAEKKNVKKLYAIMNGVQSHSRYGSYGYGAYGYGYGNYGYHDDGLPRKRDWWKNQAKRLKKLVDSASN